MTFHNSDYHHKSGEPRRTTARTSLNHEEGLLGLISCVLFHNQVTLARIFTSCDDQATKLQKRIFRRPYLPFQYKTINPQSILNVVQTNHRLNYYDKLCGLMFAVKQLNLSVPFDSVDISFLCEDLTRQTIHGIFDASLFILINDLLSIMSNIEEKHLRSLLKLIINTIALQIDDLSWEIIADILRKLVFDHHLSLTIDEYSNLIINGNLHESDAVRTIVENIIQQKIVKEKTPNLPELLTDPHCTASLCTLFSILPKLSPADLTKVHHFAATGAGLNPLATVLFANTMSKISKNERCRRTISAYCYNIIYENARDHTIDTPAIIYMEQLKLYIRESNVDKACFLFSHFLEQLHTHNVNRFQVIFLIKILAVNNKYISICFKPILELLASQYYGSANPRLLTNILSLLLRSVDNIDADAAELIFKQLSRLWYSNHVFKISNQSTRKFLSLLTKKMSKTALDKFNAKILVNAIEKNADSLTQLAFMQRENRLLRAELKKCMDLTNHPESAKRYQAWFKVINLWPLLSAPEQEENLLKLLNQGNTKDYSYFISRGIEIYLEQFGALPIKFILNLISLYKNAEPSLSKFFLDLLLSMPHVFAKEPQALERMTDLLHEIIDQSWSASSCGLKEKIDHFYLNLAVSCQDDWLRKEIDFYISNAEQNNVTPRFNFIFKIRDAITQELKNTAEVRRADLKRGINLRRTLC